MPQKISNIIGYTALLLLIAASTYSAEIQYTLAPIDAPNIWAPIAINDRGDVLFERQLEQFAPPVPLVLRHGEESDPFQCPGTTNDTQAEAFNDADHIVGSCGANPGFTLQTFLASAKSGKARFFAYPGATANTTVGKGVNNRDVVVGYYFQGSQWHGFIWEARTGAYKTLDHPRAAAGDDTFLLAISDGGQILGLVSDGFHFGDPFLYVNGAFIDLDTVSLGLRVLGQASTGQALVELRDSTLAILDQGKLKPLTLDQPNSVPDPNGNVRPCSLFNLSSLNNRLQFVGSCSRVLEWKPSPFEPGEFDPAKTEVINFVASPKKEGRK